MADFVSITEVTSNLSSIEIVSVPIFNDFHRKINFEDKKIQSNLRGGGGGRGRFNEGMRGEIWEG